MSELHETKAELVAALKESEDWKTFILDLEQVIFAEIKEHKGSPWYTMLMDIVASAVTKCGAEALEAIKGSAGIPAEWKAAGWPVWSQFIIEFLVTEANIIVSIFAK